jgi:ribosomal protein S18 acetylase RimI-like enzyme
MRPRAGEAYHYDLYVRPEARRRGIATALLATAAFDAWRHRYRWYSAHVHRLNVAGRAAQRAVGARRQEAWIGIDVAGHWHLRLRSVRV